MFVNNHTFIIHKPDNFIEMFEVIADLWIKYGGKSCQSIDLEDPKYVT